MTSCATDSNLRTVHIRGIPGERQAEFFASDAKYTAYGGARGGGKSWALRRKLVMMCIRYPGIRCLIIRRTIGELKSNHLLPMLAEYGSFASYNDANKCLSFPGGSAVFFGYCAADRDVLRYQGQEYDVIAIDEATQLSEYQFSIFKACLRGTSSYPRRIYLTCNPGGIGHAWVKRLFIDRCYRDGEKPDDYRFIQATVFDNRPLLDSDPDYVSRLESLPPKLREAWLYGRWDVFEGQFFPEFNEEKHAADIGLLPKPGVRFISFDYGLDMLAALLIGVCRDGKLTVEKELCLPGLTIGEAAIRIAELSSGTAEYAVASPDLWNRRQDSGKSGFEIMQGTPGMPPMCPADSRRIAGWRVLREYLSGNRLIIANNCTELIRCLPALLFDRNRREDAADEPHAVTHAPEALRYAVMSRAVCPSEKESYLANFRFNRAPEAHPYSWSN